MALAVTSGQACPSPNGPFSIDLWAERTGPVNYSLSIATISGWRYITDVLDGIILSPGNELDFRNWDGNQTVFLQSGVTMQQSVWYNIAVTFDGSNLSMYVNGALAASTPFEQSAVNSDEFDLGAIVSNYGQNRAFNGSLSTVQIYNRALSLDEVATLYSAPLQSFNGQTLWFNAADTNANSTVIPNLVSNSTYGILENGATVSVTSGPLQLYSQSYLGSIASEALTASTKFLPYTELDFLAKESIKNLTVLVVISSRTLGWIQSGGQNWFTSYPTGENVSQTLFPQFQGSNQFKLIYDSNEILVYEMTQTVATPLSLSA